jgi:dinuclear metal center YbgI/SA1388 family protein
VAERDQIIEFCDELLQIDRFTDYGPNGLQVPGSAEVTRVATAVSAHRASIEAAIEAGAQLLLTHHGLFWDFHPRALSEQMAARLKLALTADLSIAGYHLPLDAHPGIGNNALLVEQLGFTLATENGAPERFAAVKGSPIGMIGRHPDPRGISVAELTGRLHKLLDRPPLLQGAGPECVTSIGVVTGSATSEIHEAITLGLDAFITGEASEHVLADATEGGIHFFAAGHYATEVAGIRRLGETVAAEFGVEHLFLDIPNPV